MAPSCCEPLHEALYFRKETFHEAAARASKVGTCLWAFRKSWQCTGTEASDLIQLCHALLYLRAHENIRHIIAAFHSQALDDSLSVLLLTGHRVWGYEILQLKEDSRRRKLVPTTATEVLLCAPYWRRPQHGRQPSTLPEWHWHLIGKVARKEAP